ncbi:MAG: ABC-type transport auxiliary lipoprotein family protein [Polyangiaceae bacterium]|jgi:cholesterol transport system auxiliary component
MKNRRAWCMAALLPQLVGCAFLFKSDPFVSRYFTPESVATPAEPVAPSGLELRLGRVSAAAYIKDEIVFRNSIYEIGYYEGRRWTDKPESYVRRELARALFDRRGIRQIAYGAGATLDVDVRAFEEVRAPAHVGRVTIDYSLVDHRVVRFARSVTIERAIAPATGDAEADAIVMALSTALVDSVNIVADKATAELRAEGSGSAPVADETPEHDP